MGNTAKQLPINHQSHNHSQQRDTVKSKKAAYHQPCFIHLKTSTYFQIYFVEEDSKKAVVIGKPSGVIRAESDDVRSETEGNGGGHRHKTAASWKS